MPRTFVTAAFTPATDRATARAYDPTPGTFMSLPDDKQAGLFYFDADLVHEGPNANGHIFTAEEMRRSWQTLLGQPIDVDHEFTVEAAVGKVYAVRLVEESPLAIRIAGFVSEEFYPELVWKMRNGIITGVSMECQFDSVTRTPRGTILHGVDFIGLGIVRVPADDNARVRPGYAASASGDNRLDAILRYAASCLTPTTVRTS